MPPRRTRRRRDIPRRTRRRRDMISSLSNYHLLLIISKLPFKEALMTSVLSKRWRNLCYEITNISFKESDFLRYSAADNEETKRARRISFVRFMVNWVSRFTGAEIESFELCLSKPVGFETEMKSLVEFAVTKQVENLVIDFSDPSWINDDQAEVEASLFQLPECVYCLASLESLKLLGCRFDPSRVSNLGLIKSFCFGWTHLENIMSLISMSPLLESLIITNCWNVGIETITEYNNQLIELIIDNCDFAKELIEYIALDLPNIQTFKYSGKVYRFQFMQVNKILKEAYLEFGHETEYDADIARILCELLYDLCSAQTFTVCPYLIQAIQDCEDPTLAKAPMDTKHLIMKTNLLPNEFFGIRFLMNCCWYLETLTFVMVPLRTVSYKEIDFDVDMYWRSNITNRCLKKTLKVVEVRNYGAGVCEIEVLEYLIRYGRVLERVDLYMSSELEEGEKSYARASAVMMSTRSKRSSDRLRVHLHNA